jgi:phage tail sheath protein FI
LKGDGGDLVLQASSVGGWGNSLTATVDNNMLSAPAAGAKRTTFNLTITQNANASAASVVAAGKSAGTPAAAIERFLNVSVDPKSPNFVTNVLANQSSLVIVAPAAKAVFLPNPATVQADGKGANGGVPGDADLTGDGIDGFQENKHGIYALAKADIFNLLCIPPLTQGTTLSVPVVTAAVAYCETRRAMMIVDAPDGWGKAVTAVTGAQDLSGNVGALSRNAALFFPRIKQPNPLMNNQMQEFVPCGAIAGVFARTDGQRGVWKAPAGVDATLVNVPQLTVPLHDGENGDLNPLGVNCLRAFPVVGRVVWGSRTTKGADVLADDYKYIPVRRLALFIEESLYRGTQWVVFEPNDEPLWSQIRLNVGAFMQNLFRQGAFQGQTPTDAYFVKCDKETTIQNDIDLGIVNVIVGFAPLKPAEFVVIQLQQIAGQIQV